jgi:hypothetical protein
MGRHANDKKILDMVAEELHSINKIKNVSMSIKEFNKIKYPAQSIIQAEICAHSKEGYFLKRIKGSL